MRPIPILLTIAAIAVPVMPIAAAEPATDPAAVTMTSITTASDAAADGAFTGAAMLAEDDLGAIAGREDTGTMAAVADQRNTVQGNSVTGTSVTGTVTIDGQAFQNLSGLSVISANSGNNVAINSAMNVVINLAPQ